ncbi:MAG TPA: phage tail protein, partial [Pyrinomonadaceae bacterium]|nr:phage tail protein [Pyrinomonadaceae bacterium]
FAVAQCNQLYILDVPDKESEAPPAIWIYDTSQKLIEKIDCISPLFKDPTSITYAAGTLYVADVKAESRIYGLSDQNWQIKFAIGAFPRNDTQSLAQAFEPIDLAVDGAGNLFALDQSTPAILKFDQTFQLVSIFGEAELAGKQPKTFALSRDGFLYVLDPSEQKVLKFQAGECAAVNTNFIDFEKLETSGELPKEFRPGGFAVDNDGYLFVGDAGLRRDDQEDDRFIRKFDPDGKYLGVVADSRGAADQLAVDLNDSIFIFRKEEKNKITALRRERRFALLQSASLVKGEHISKSLDSREPGTIWHKLNSETTPAANAQIQVSFLASDEMVKVRGRDLDSLLDETAALDPTQQKEIEDRLTDLDKLDWSTPIVNSDDALIAAEGRYLWIRILLIGNEQESPLLRSLRVDYPRLSYLRYLPSVYQEDERSRDFLERFLSLFETFFAGIETRVDYIARYFDADAGSVSGDFLRWLSTWLAVSVDNNWDEAKLRLLVKRASEIYKKRGTRSAIEDMIEILTGQQPIIVEHHQIACDSWSLQQQELDFQELKQLFRRLYGKDSFDDDQLKNSFVLAKLYERLYGKDPFCFCVLLRPPVQTEKRDKAVRQTEEHYKAVRRILDSEKPAHTCAGLLALQPWIQLDTHTYLEVNTYLSEPSARLDLGSAMPRDTVLNDYEEAGQLEWHSRIDLDMTLT